MICRVGSTSHLWKVWVFCLPVYPLQSIPCKIKVISHPLWYLRDPSKSPFASPSLVFEIRTFPWEPDVFLWHLGGPGKISNVSCTTIELFSFIGIQVPLHTYIHLRSGHFPLAFGTFCLILFGIWDPDICLRSADFFLRSAPSQVPDNVLVPFCLALFGIWDPDVFLWHLGVFPDKYCLGEIWIVFIHWPKMPTFSWNYNLVSDLGSILKAYIHTYIHT